MLKSRSTKILPSIYQMMLEVISRSDMKATMKLLSFISFMFASSASYGEMALSKKWQVWEVANISQAGTLNVRAGPSTNFPVVFKLPFGSTGLHKYECVLLKPSPNSKNTLPLPEWCAITEGEGPIGWVNARYLVPVEADVGSLPFLGGYRGQDDPCQVLGENDLTSDFLDHTATLVGCPLGDNGIEELIQKMEAQIVTKRNGYAVLSVPD